MGSQSQSEVWDEAAQRLAVEVYSLTQCLAWPANHNQSLIWCSVQLVFKMCRFKSWIFSILLHHKWQFTANSLPELVKMTYCSNKLATTPGTHFICVCCSYTWENWTKTKHNVLLWIDHWTQLNTEQLYYLSLQLLAFTQTTPTKPDWV